MICGVNMGQRLSAKKIEFAKVGKHADGNGLYLIVEKSGSKGWWFIFSWGGKRPEMKLGDASKGGMSLAQAREAVVMARRRVREGVNPIEARREARSRDVDAVTFGQVADEYFDAKKVEYRNEKYREMVRVALTRTLAPLRPIPVAEVTTESVLAALKPVWVAAPETGKRLREKIEAVLDAASAKGLRQGDNPARWKGHLEHLLPKRPKVEKSHHAAMDYRAVPDFMSRLRADETMAARALAFCIFTASRSGEVYGARWSEINMAEKVWVIPPHRMKAGREHRVPLSEAALEILEKLEKTKTCDFIFTSPRGPRPLSHIAMAKVLNRLGVDGATVHGFRSGFRDWAGHETHFPREIAEQALAHRLGDAAELAYKRGDFLEKRRDLMQAWAQFCAPSSAGNIVKFQRSSGKPA